MIAEAKLDALISVSDPLGAHPHDVAAKASLRVAILYKSLLAVNEASAAAVVREA